MIRVDFRCENCGIPQSDIEVIDDEGTPDVTCSDCEHTVDVGVYLGPDWKELLEERDPPMWDKPGQLAPAVNGLRETLEAHGHADHDEDCITLCPVDPQSDKCRVLHGCWCSEHAEVGAHPE